MEKILINKLNNNITKIIQNYNINILDKRKLFEELKYSTVLIKIILNKISYNHLIKIMSCNQCDNYKYGYIIWSIKTSE